MPMQMKAEGSSYYAVIFTSVLKGERGYEEMSRAMVENVSKQPGFLGFDSAREPEGLGITVSYWESLEAVRAWKENASHLTAQKMGREHWYSSYQIRVAKVLEEREFAGEP